MVVVPCGDATGSIGVEEPDGRARIGASLRPAASSPARVCCTGEWTSTSRRIALPERFDAGTGLVALGAVLLIVSLFIDWFSPGADAWAVFEIADVVLVGCAIAGLVAALPRYTGLSRAMPAIAFAALAVVAVQLIDRPPAARGAEIETGAWLALAGTLLMTLGAAMSLASITVTVAVRGRERRRRTPAIDARDGEAAAHPRPHADEQETALATEEPRRSRRRAAGAVAATEPVDSSAAPVAPRRPARPASDDEQPRTPAAAEPRDDPERTQALDPVDRPGEGS
jgi:hypothetical protein